MKSSRHIQYTPSSSGAIALFMILVISAGILILSTNAAWLGLGELESGYINVQAGKALAIADGCAEAVMERLRTNNNYGIGAGTLNFTIGSDTCAVTVVSGGGNVRTITSTSTTGNYAKKVIVTVTATGSTVTVTNWVESTS